MNAAGCSGNFHALLMGWLLLGSFNQSSVGQPANDFFTNRIVVAGTNLTIQGSNYGAGTEAGENTGNAGALILYTVWYSWTAPASGFAHLAGSSPRSSFFVNLAVYRGNSITTLTSATPTNGGSAIIVTNGEAAFAVTNGDTLQIQVGSVYYPFWGGGGDWGPFTMTLWLEPPPSGVLDQSQMIFSAWEDLRDVDQNIALGQTFRPAISGKLDHLYLVGAFGEIIPERPTTVSIVDTADEQPGTNVLGRIVVPHLLGEMRISFDAQDIYLSSRGNSLRYRAEHRCAARQLRHLQFSDWRKFSSRGRRLSERHIVAAGPRWPVASSPTG